MRASKLGTHVPFYTPPEEDRVTNPLTIEVKIFKQYADIIYKMIFLHIWTLNSKQQDKAVLELMVGDLKLLHAQIDLMALASGVLALLGADANVVSCPFVLVWLSCMPQHMSLLLA